MGRIPMKTPKELNELLVQDVESIAKLLFPNGRKIGPHWCAGDITGNPGQSLKIVITGSKKGLWSDFASGETGDLIHLWQKNKSLTFAETLKQIRTYLGIQEPTFETPPQKQFSKPSKNGLRSVENDPVVYQWLSEQRSLHLEAIRAFKVVSKQGMAAFPYLKSSELLFLKYIEPPKGNEKKKIFTQKDCQPCLFGWQTVKEGEREVTLCEGEIDAMSLWQLGRTALSVPFGGGSGAKQSWIEYEFEDLLQFDTIFLVR